MCSNYLIIILGEFVNMRDLWREFFVELEEENESKDSYLIFIQNNCILN